MLVMATMGNVGEAARSFLDGASAGGLYEEGWPWGSRTRLRVRPAMRIMTRRRPDLTYLMHIKPGHDEKLTRADVWSPGPCR